MESRRGLLLAMEENGLLQRILLSETEKKLKKSTVEQLVIEYSELNFLPYAEVVNVIITAANFLVVEGEDQIGKVDMNVFTFMMETVEDLVSTLEQEKPLQGTLLRVALKERVPKDDGSAACAYQASHGVINALTAVMDFQFVVNGVLDDLRNGRPLDLDGKYSFLRQTEITQVLTLGKNLSAMYLVRSPEEYYRLLLLWFISRNPQVALCECCGRYFVPATKKKTLYCDRILKGGKTCKEWGPKLKHQLVAQKHKVVEEFDRAKRRMYKRYERTKVRLDPLPDAFSYNDYYAWLDKAVDARDKYLAGEMPEEKALEIICGEPGT